MILSNKELTVLIEALKSTTAYQNSRGCYARSEGKEYTSHMVGRREKNDMVYELVIHLEEIQLSTEALPSNQMFDVVSSIDIQEFSTPTVSMPIV